MVGLIEGEPRALTKRGITAETCAKFGYIIGPDKNGVLVQAASYRDRATGTQVVAQHLRYADKEMPWVGDMAEAGLFGQHLWRDGGKRIVITEGEIDCMSVAQAFGLSWPVVSIKRGAKGAKRDLQESLEFLQTYEKIVLWFDADAPGREAVAECVPLFRPGTVFTVETPQ